MMASSAHKTMCSLRDESQTEPSYFNLRRLAAYSNCSVRWLRDRLVDQSLPLPHHRVGGKLLVRKDDFDRWMDVHRVIHQSDRLSRIVENVMADVYPHRGSLDKFSSGAHKTCP